jgi:hypothetical protein
MLYRPKFCSECGERIERAEWRLTSSRQYCDLCATEHPITNRIPLVSVAIIGLLLVVGAKTAFFPVIVGEPQPLVSQPVRNDSKATALKSQAKPTENPDPVSSSSENASNSGVERETVKDKNAGNTYYCGAPTKKGTPCSRRVKTKGYCWQHDKTED